VERLTYTSTSCTAHKNADTTVLNADSVENPDNNNATPDFTASDGETIPTSDEMDTSDPSDTATSPYIYKSLSSSPTLPNDNILNSTLTEFAFRKSYAEAGSRRKSCHLDKLAPEDEFHSLPSRPPSEHQSHQLNERGRLQLKLSLIEADITFYGMRMELDDWQLRNETDISSPLSVEETKRECEVLKAQVRKAWYNAEVAFVMLVLARPAFPSQ
jgi:hypothetical protein